MQFSAAYEALGYALENHRTDWSAQKPGGVCLSMWEIEIEGLEDDRPVMDFLKMHPAGPPSWTRKIGHKKRTKHLKKAVRDYDGYIDVVLLAGNPEWGFGDAMPWHPEEHAGRVWQVTQFDPATGLFRAEVTDKKEGAS